MGGLIACGSIFLCNTAIYRFLRYSTTVAAYLLLLFCLLFAGGLMWIWGANMPVAMLTFVLAIILAGILLTAFHALFIAILSAILVIGLQVLAHIGLVAGNGLSLGDTLTCCVLFFVIALILCLSIQESERTLARAKQAETILLEQKTALKMQARRHMTDLRHMQLMEMRQVYRSAELGYQGVTLLHDLANHLTALKLEVGALEIERHSGAIIPTQKIVQHLEDMVESTCERLHGGSQEQKFNLIKKISEVSALLQDKAIERNIKIDWRPPARSWKYCGDAASLCQVISILTKNAMDAYGHSSVQGDTLRRVSVRLQRTGTHFIIRIGDWGVGISERTQKHLFEPFHSTKRTGLGLGLHIAKCITEVQFVGTIELNSHSDHTEFIVTIPRVNPNK